MFLIEFVVIVAMGYMLVVTTPHSSPDTPARTL